MLDDLKEQIAVARARSGDHPFNHKVRYDRWGTEYWEFPDGYLLGATGEVEIRQGFAVTPLPPGAKEHIPSEPSGFTLGLTGATMFAAWLPLFRAAAGGGSVVQQWDPFGIHEDHVWYGEKHFPGHPDYVRPEAGDTWPWSLPDPMDVDNVRWDELYGPGGPIFPGGPGGTPTQSWFSPRLTSDTLRQSRISAPGGSLTLVELLRLTSRF
jgi:hypothetical protein